MVAYTLPIRTGGVAVAVVHLRCCSADATPGCDDPSNCTLSLRGSKMSIRMQAFAAVLGATLAAVGVAQQPDRIDTELNAKIREEGLDRSKIMWIEHYLTDVYGPRPIGSPNHVAAANWAMKTMTSWGMKNAHLEPFTWRGVGWLPGKATGFITSPVKANLKFEAVPWSPSTNGTVSGEVVSIVPPVSPTEEELTAFLASHASKVKGGIVMIGAP